MNRSTLARLDRLRCLAFENQAKLLALWVLFAIGVNKAAMLLDRTPFAYDMAYKYATSLNYYRHFFGGEPLATSGFCYKEPHLMQILSVLFFPFRSGADPDRLCWLGQIFFAVLIVAVYLLVRRLTAGETTIAPLVAAVLTGATPLIGGASKVFMHDLPMAAMLWAAFVAMLFSEGYSRPFRALLFGVFTGCGLMMKQTFVVFFALPWLVHLVASARHRENRLRRLTGFALWLVAVLAIAAPWYLRCGRSTYLFNVQTNGLPTAWDRLVFGRQYWDLLLSEQIGIPLAVLAGVGLIRLCYVRSLRTRYGAFAAVGAASFLASYAFFSSTALILSRFVIAWIPLFPIVFALGWSAASDHPDEPTAPDHRITRSRLLVAVAFLAVMLLWKFRLVTEPLPHVVGDRPLDHSLLFTLLPYLALTAMGLLFIAFAPTHWFIRLGAAMSRPLEIARVAVPPILVFGYIAAFVAVSFVPVTGGNDHPWLRPYFHTYDPWTRPTFAVNIGLFGLDRGGIDPHRLVETLQTEASQEKTMWTKNVLFIYDDTYRAESAVLLASLRKSPRWIGRIVPIATSALPRDWPARCRDLFNWQDLLLIEGDSLWAIAPFLEQIKKPAFGVGDLEWDAIDHRSHYFGIYRNLKPNLIDLERVDPACFGTTPTPRP